MTKITGLTNGQEKLVYSNRFLLIPFLEGLSVSGKRWKEEREITISSLSKEINLSYRATYKRIANLTKKEIIIPEKKKNRKGQPIILRINPHYLSGINVFVKIRTHEYSEKKKSKEWLLKPETFKILKTIRKFEKPINFSEISRRIKGINGLSLFLSNLEENGMIDIRYHITRKGSAFYHKNKLNQEVHDGKNK